MKTIPLTYESFLRWSFALKSGVGLLMIKSAHEDGVSSKVIARRLGWEDIDVQDAIKNKTWELVL